MSEPFQQVNTQDRILQLIQANVAKALQPLFNQPMAGGVLLSAVSLVAGQDNLIRHGLGYAPTLIFTSLPTAQSTVWSPTSSTLNGKNADEVNINVRCSTNCKVSLWVA